MGEQVVEETLIDWLPLPQIKRKIDASLVVQRLRICLPMRGTRVPSLVRELRSPMPQGK